MKIVAIIQARLGSKRLPKKTLKLFHGYPLIDWVVSRVSATPLISECCVAIPDVKADDDLAKHLMSIGALSFRGDEADVLGRVHGAAKEMNADLVIRVCGDNPLVCSLELNKLIEFYLENDFDYAYNHIPRNNLYSDGFGGEICSMNLLNKIVNDAVSTSHREHMFNYIWENPDQFRIGTFNPSRDLQFPTLRFDVDTLDDFNYLSSKSISMHMTAQEIIRIFKSN